MTHLESLKRPKGSKKSAKRVGRGPGSGVGKTAGRGHKGQKARAGGSLKPWFEGGQMPLQRRLPKRGFRPYKRTEYQVVNVRDLGRVEGDEVTPEALKQAGLIGSLRRPVKILGEGELDRALQVTAHAFSRTAREKIEGAGGATNEAD
ncbi:MAG: 50S ribosomal protein L15 [Gemmatimonadetes bacterium]|uniref:Large ribosomal subunit protein uL15 n=1 Tax=Candidatus Kutchimonas denitrificans TaxID=3056748 RepID=A0AAE4Z805_9BACT|nr:50S ribosomal protein L15 [Gemmatimonadota bacterium]NIR73866.1 50S ribosomal protein L15 [Candidatus Kutchimonas denitrificans]NIR99672.1 50S ribosomal protein L15 [Gemmatimonadota bacterium]NIT65257.1 50S ribosomal protein L15 [Gemmatimonadota bacterium]NIW73706.1 50S ribosomal protein L15 [Gemmatimonadota bacterium]